MNNVILSTRYPIFAEKLRSLGYRVIPSERIDTLLSYEQDHADMQCLLLDDTAFVLDQCDTLQNALSSTYKVIKCKVEVRAPYPNNVALNAAVVGNSVIARLDSLADEVKAYCASNGHELINVRQGYAKCSCAVVSDNAIITADRGIYHSLKESKMDVLLVEEGRVTLEGAGYGFIGGASGLNTGANKRTLYFSGNITALPDYERIKAFCAKHKTTIISLTDTALTDIGGMIFC